MTTKKPNKILITTAIDYTNAVIHVGHAYQKIFADFLARYYRQINGADKVYFLTGTDEYGTTNEKAAVERGLSPKEHVNDISKQNRDQLDSLNISYDRFIRTTDEDHKGFAQEFVKKAHENGYIYKGEYEGLYCEGCESYKTLSELNEEGQCLLHPTRVIQKVSEENYFFKWSEFSDFLRDLVQNSDFVLPESKRNEMVSFIDKGLLDLPISRPKYKVEWGIEFPIDPEHVIYVWFDALINYYTAGFQNGFWSDDTFILHILGKDNARWHILLWPAMLKAAGKRLPDRVYVHGFINLNGEKISKSRGNIIRPDELVTEFGSDAVRYYFLRHGPIVEDVNISLDKFKEIYNADLANGLGNTVARLTKLAERSGFEFELDLVESFNTEVSESVENYRPDLAIQTIWTRLSDLDKHINENTPWSIEDPEKLREILNYELNELRKIAWETQAVLPEASVKVLQDLGAKKISALSGLFPRK